MVLDAVVSTFSLRESGNLDKNPHAKSASATIAIGTQIKYLLRERRATGLGLGGADGDEDTGVPQAGQNFAPSGTGAPQIEHGFLAIASEKSYRTRQRAGRTLAA